MPNNAKFLYQTKEFSYEYQIDSLGFRNTSSKKKDSSALLLFLGDSFTEGVGTANDSTWPQLFAKALYKHGYACHAYNAGMHGSDPFFEDYILRHKLYSLRPAAVIQCINYSDLLEYIWRGGSERFQADGSVVFRRGPWWEPVYHYSHLFRLIIHGLFRYDFTLLSKTNFRLALQDAIKANAACIAGTSAWCKEKHIAYSLIIHPYPLSFARMLQGHDDIKQVAHYIPKETECVDLFSAFQLQLNKSNYKCYSWPVDGHFNAKGYQLFAQLYIDELLKRHSVIIEACKKP